jgi:hypothetical protein
MIPWEQNVQFLCQALKIQQLQKAEEPWLAAVVDEISVLLAKSTTAFHGFPLYVYTFQGWCTYFLLFLLWSLVFNFNISRLGLDQPSRAPSGCTWTLQLSGQRARISASFCWCKWR